MKIDLLQRRIYAYVGVAIIVVGVIVLWHYGPTLQQIVTDRDRLQTLVEALGWFGPIALIGLNALQIVVAPVPGYVVQLAAGFLYGPWWGGLWGTLGLFAGSMTAMWLARAYGRPLVERVVGADRVQQWEEVIHSENIYIWFVLLLGPTGDAPYYLAGLSRVRFVHIALITLLIRVPSVFVVAAVGAGVLTLTWWQFLLVLATVGLLTLLLLRQRESLTIWSDRLLRKFALRYTPISHHQSAVNRPTASKKGAPLLHKDV